MVTLADKDTLILEIETIINKSFLEQTDKIIGQIEKKAKKTEKAINDFTGSFKALGAAVAGYLSAEKIMQGIDLASDFSESRSKLESVFSSQIEDADNFIKNMAESLHLGKRQLETEMADIGGVLAGMGFNEKDLLNGTGLVMELSKDLASFSNRGFEEAQRALLGGLTGEAEALKSMGVLIQDQDMSEFVRNLDLGFKWEDLDNGAKAYMRLIAVREKMLKQGSVGDVLRTKDDFASVQKQIQSLTQTITGDFFSGMKDAMLPSMLKLREFLINNGDEISNVGEKVGEFVGKVLAGANSVATFIGENKELVSIIGTLATSIAGLIGAYKVGVAVSTLFTTATAILNGTLLLNPVGIVVASLAVLGTAFYTVYQKSETFRNAISAVFDTVKKFWEYLKGLTMPKWLSGTLEKLGLKKADTEENKENDVEKKITEETNKVTNNKVQQEVENVTVNKVKDKVEKENKRQKQQENIVETEKSITKEVEKVKTSDKSGDSYSIKINVETKLIDLQERLSKAVRNEIEAYEREQLSNVGLI